MGKDIKTKGVSFNVVDPHQRRLYEHAARHTNFSAYVKSLIQRDMEGGQSAPSVEMKPSFDVKTVSEFV
ncbi:hypothetical protein [Geobacillus kaustophilus]|uniref:hypothetical protein n=1 Tax=Geobacillus kaustophilus TaxID=1462 RepID=UPI0005CD8349|nr:hypothetical protein [Geobacillus kaustophilus]